MNEALEMFFAVNSEATVHCKTESLFSVEVGEGGKTVRNQILLIQFTLPGFCSVFGMHDGSKGIRDGKQ